MPTYEYVCDQCGHTFDEMQSFKGRAAEGLSQVPSGRTLRRPLRPPGPRFLFKGSGFYETDYRSESYKKSAKARAGRDEVEQHVLDRPTGKPAESKPRRNQEQPAHPPSPGDGKSDAMKAPDLPRLQQPRWKGPSRKWALLPPSAAKKCRTIDLGRWLTGDYELPVIEPDLGEVEDEAFLTGRFIGRFHKRGARLQGRAPRSFRGVGGRRSTSAEEEEAKPQAGVRASEWRIAPVDGWPLSPFARTPLAVFASSLGRTWTSRRHVTDAHRVRTPHAQRLDPVP